METIVLATLVVIGVFVTALFKILSLLDKELDGEEEEDRRRRYEQEMESDPWFLYFQDRAKEREEEEKAQQMDFEQRLRKIIREELDRS